jgi:DNA recombination protein RmuC
MLTPDTLIVAGLLAAVAALQVLALLRRQASQEDVRRLEGLLREELGRGRDASAAEARALRDETARALRDLGEASARAAGQIGEAQREQLRLFSDRLEALTRSLAEGAALQRSELGANQARLDDALKLQLESLRAAVTGELEKVRAENAAKLEEMRRTVDEKLHDTLEKRLGESFERVSRRLEDVAKGLGEMQQLATGVGDLKNVLTNVKSRGTWGEFQLGALLAEILTPEQYAANVKTNPRSDERVEFAVRLPGRSDEAGPVWLPVDAKFPKEDYERLQAAADRADKEAVETALRGLERRIKDSAKDIHDKYLAPPFTTDFGILFLPTEGLYAEVLRRPGLVDDLQRTYRVSVAGPTTLTALLNSLQMGFRTLAIEKRSSEVWRVLGAVKGEFLKFGEVFERVQRKIEDADKILKSAEVRTRAMNRKLRSVEALPEAEGLRQLELEAAEEPGTEEAETP